MGEVVKYGQRNGELIHVDEVERGLACDCICTECHRTLIAKKGDVLEHHFAHEADDIICNPSPETLIHSFAKQQVAKLTTLILPGFEVEVDTEWADRIRHTAHWRAHPYFRLPVISASVEVDLGTVKPDVLCQVGPKPIAVEVYFRHKVDAEKIERFQREHYLSAVELDLSDLPVHASAEQINAAIHHPQRWTWLSNMYIRHFGDRLRTVLTISTRIFVPSKVEVVPYVTGNKIPSRLLNDADKLWERAGKMLEQLRTMPVESRAAAIGDYSTEQRVAVHCRQIGIRPSALPIHLMQTISGQSTIGFHPVVWQTGIFAKFCMQGSEFGVRLVETWMRETFVRESFNSLTSITQSPNGFTEMGQALYHFLRNLSAQNLLTEIKGTKPWLSTFCAVAPSRADILNLLILKSAALHHREHSMRAEM
ncbi:hypothetical protein [Undibacterium sp.]|uniref:hypothetical protein n=1 Tax=Undibacterium sp. TaxID=1914977 RepID=UPI0025ECF44B|nr:hypothetical protein [Undibacterium sp.]